MRNLFIPSKKTLILIAGLGIFILVLGLISFFSNPEPIQSPESTPTTSPLPFTNLPSPQGDSTSRFSQIFQENSVERNYERISDRKPLPENEQIIKARLLKLTQGKSGVIHQAALFTVEYLKSADYFMAQITSTQTDLAKRNITSWFLEQGFSQQGVCNLPVVLYLTTDVRDYLLQNNLTFDPTPEGCQ